MILEQNNSDDYKAIKLFIDSLSEDLPIHVSDRRKMLKKKWRKFVIDFMSKDCRVTAKTFLMLNKMNTDEMIEVMKPTIFGFDQIFEIYNSAAAQLAITQQDDGG